MSKERIYQFVDELPTDNAGKSKVMLAIYDAIARWFLRGTANGDGTQSARSNLRVLPRLDTVVQFWYGQEPVLR